MQNNKIIWIFDLVHSCLIKAHSVEFCIQMENFIKIQYQLKIIHCDIEFDLLRLWTIVKESPPNVTSVKKAIVKFMKTLSVSMTPSNLSHSHGYTSCPRGRVTQSYEYTFPKKTWKLWLKMPFKYNEIFLRHMLSDVRDCDCIRHALGCIAFKCSLNILKLN